MNLTRVNHEKEHVLRPGRGHLLQVVLPVFPGPQQCHCLLVTGRLPLRGVPQGVPSVGSAFGAPLPLQFPSTGPGLVEAPLYSLAPARLPSGSPGPPTFTCCHSPQGTDQYPTSISFTVTSVKYEQKKGKHIHNSPDTPSFSIIYLLLKSASFMITIKDHRQFCIFLCSIRQTYASSRPRHFPRSQMV